MTDPTNPSGPPERQQRRPDNRRRRPPANESARNRQESRQSGPPDSRQDGRQESPAAERPAARQGGGQRGGQRSRPGAAQGGGESGGGPRGRLRVIPLGGVGEVGKNMTAVEFERDLVLLDCGAKFPEEEQRGVDLIIPDISYVKERRRNLRAILITHGHEDHIGGVPYIVQQLKGGPRVPIYGSPLALGLIDRKLGEHRLGKYVELRAVQPGQKVEFGRLTAEFIHVTHSIPDTNAIAIHSPVGTIVDTADFKFDPTPVMGEPSDEARLQRLGDAGVLALFSDTVRVEIKGSTPSERVVLETIDRVVGRSRNQVIIATFASNISRLHMALLAAQKHGRKVAVAGRSMEQSAQVAIDLGYLAPPDGLLIPLDEIMRLPKEQRVLVITGSQGEASAALARIAAGEHPKIKIGSGDVVLVSASPVPGNEETVAGTIDNLFRRGVDVVYNTLEPGVHVSGHAGREELRRMLKLLRPRYAVPIHGEFRHMALYRRLCAEVGIPGERVFMPEIGGILEFSGKKASQTGRAPSGSVLVDRLGDRREGQVVLRDRAHLADDGVVVVTIVVDRESGELIAGPDLVAKGLRPDLRDGALREAENDLRKVLGKKPKGGPQYGYIVQRAKEIVGTSLYKRSKSRPMILPVVTEL